MVTIETFNLNEDLQQDYDDADDLELNYSFKANGWKNFNAKWVIYF